MLLSGDIIDDAVSFTDFNGNANKMPFRISDVYNPKNKLLWFNLSIYSDAVFANKGWIEMVDNNMDTDVQRYNVPSLLGGAGLGFFYKPYFDKDNGTLISVMRADNSIVSNPDLGSSETAVIIKFTLDFDDITNTTYEIIGELTDYVSNMDGSIIHYNNETNVIQIIKTRNNKNANSQYFKVNLSTQTIITENIIPNGRIVNSLNTIDSNSYVSEQEIYLYSWNASLFGFVFADVSFERYNAVTNSIEKVVVAPNPEDFDTTNKNMRVWHFTQKYGIVERIGLIQNTRVYIHENYNLNNETRLPDYVRNSFLGQTQATGQGSVFKDLETGTTYAKLVISSSGGYTADNLRYFYKLLNNQTDKTIPLLSGNVVSGEQSNKSVILQNDL